MEKSCQPNIASPEIKLDIVIDFESLVLYTVSNVLLHKKF